MIGVLWKYAAGGLLFLWIITMVGYQVEKRGHAKANQRIVELTQKLNDISSKRNEQKAETAKRITVVKEQIRHADDQAKVIEQAPLPGQCRSPKEVLDADI